jgi:hypothetical protein
VSKTFNEPILVYVDKSSKLTAFIWRKRLYHVLEIISSWWEAGDWWDGKPECLMLRVLAEKGTTGIYELCNNGAQWFIRRLLD